MFKYFLICLFICFSFEIKADHSGVWLFGNYNAQLILRIVENYPTPEDVNNEINTNKPLGDLSSISAKTLLHGEYIDGKINFSNNINIYGFWL